jgi:hypothetical protein
MSDVSNANMHAAAQPYAVLSEDRRRKLWRVSVVAKVLALVSIALVVGYCAYLVVDPWALATFLQKDVPGVPITPATETLALAGALSLVPIAVFVAAMWQAFGLFHHLGQAQSFDSRAQHHLLTLAKLAIAAAVLGVVVRTLVVLVMTSANPFGQRHLVIGIGSNEMAALMIGCVMYAFAQLVQEFQRVEDENRSFI